MAARTGHASEGVSKARTDDEDRDDLDVIGKRAWVLVRMRAVGVKESAAVGAEHFYGFLRRDGALADGLGLGGLLKSVRLRVSVEILWNALPYQDDRVDDAGGREDVEHGPGHVDPEVADGGGSGALDAANECDGDNDARRRRPEVVCSETGHLREIAHGGLGHVKLPIGIGCEAGGGVKRQIGSHSGEVLRIPRQIKLQALDGVGEEHARRGESEKREGVFAPAHFLVSLNSAQPVDDALEGTEHRVEPGALAFHHARHVNAHRTHRDEQNHRVDGKLQPAVCGHVRTSPGTAVRRLGTPSGGLRG